MAKSDSLARARFAVTGTVQGVGFRPFVYRIAVREGLGGFVWNDSRGVTIEVEGRPESIGSFAKALRAELPPLAKILTLSREDIAPAGETAFRIEESRSLSERSALVTADSATCEDCLREMRDPADRRHRYPFINCTNCGPRYSIIEDIPYDRPKTTMKVFKMCPACQAEYDDPASRRFHAQPNACPVCGPRLQLLNSEGNVVETPDLVKFVIAALASGKIVAVKGLGGLHLACDAGNEDAVATLRRRKHREEKALAIMVRDISAAREIASVTRAAEKVLVSVQRPIVLLDKKKRGPLAASVAPRSKYFGVMLPYTPLHHLLMEGPYAALVMTSGNVSEEPIAKDNDEAIARLGIIADYFLVNNRDIRVRVEDSVVRVFAGRVYPVRRSRGWAPAPVILKRASPAEILAVGPELKNTITLVKGNRAYVSQHVGDLKNALAFDCFKDSVEALQKLMEVRPRAVACDLHPQYLSTRYAKSLGLPVIEVQHHHAHAASVMAERGKAGRVIGISCDGTGYGADGAVWGCEILDASLAGYKRLGHLKYVALPGGDAAVKDADRVAYSHLLAAFGGDGRLPYLPLLERLGDEKRRLIRDIIAKGVNSPPTSSLGRLFDAASAIANVAHAATYEGQPAIEFEARAAKRIDAAYPWQLEDAPGGFIIDPAPLVRALAADAASGVAAGETSAMFHNAVAEFLAASASRAREVTGLGTVTLSGGVFQNEYLLKRLAAALRADKFEVLIHREVPPNDGGISLGQAAVAAEQLRLGTVKLE
jgi:hydrogenase maturation protein HypF